MSADNKYIKALAYREKNQPQAEKLLRALTVNSPVSQDSSTPFFKRGKNITPPLKKGVDEPCEAGGFLQVLVIGAGQFTSYATLKKLLGNSHPLHFTLLEPNIPDTDFFMQHFSTKDDIFSIVNEDLSTFLKTEKKKFDFVYFEHPETMTLPLVLGKLGVKSLKRVIFFRESFPYLSNILKPGTILIASCMSTHELHQLKNLLTFSLNLHPKIISSWHPLDFFYGGPYRVGLITSFTPTKVLQKTKASAIQRSLWYLCLFLFLELIAYIFYCSQHSEPSYALERLLAVILIGSQLYFHKEGFQGLLIKLSLFALQIALFIPLA